MARVKALGPRVVAGLAVAAIGSTGCVSPPARVTVVADTVASITRESRIVAVHYHDLGTPGPPRDDTVVRARGVVLGAPTRRIKERFLASLRSAVGSHEIRSIGAPRFAYLVRIAEPDAGRLRRTFGRGLAFDFYSPWRFLPAAGGPVPGALTIQARLIRLDDLAVLWAETCTYETGVLPPPPLFPRTTGVEGLFTAVALERADHCADTLVASFTGRPKR